MSEDDPRQIAADYFQKAYALQMQGEYQQAIELYTRSIEAFATAEAYTFRGWTYSSAITTAPSPNACRRLRWIRILVILITISGLT